MYIQYVLMHFTAGVNFDDSIITSSNCNLPPGTEFYGNYGDFVWVITIPKKLKALQFMECDTFSPGNLGVVKNESNNTQLPAP